MPRKPAEQPRAGNKTITLSDYDLLHISFVNKEGRELASVDFDRVAGASPQLSMQAMGKKGQLRSANTLFDVDA